MPSYRDKVIAIRDAGICEAYMIALLKLGTLTKQDVKNIEQLWEIVKCTTTK